MYHSTYSTNVPSHNFTNDTSSQANALTPSNWFRKLHIFKPLEDKPLPFNLEVIFLDTGSSIFVFNISIFIVLANQFISKCLKSSP